jgi:magnesium chelatase subunit H
MASTASRCARTALLKKALGDVDLAYQNLESVELGVTTVDHYFDTLGGIARAVKRARGGEERRSISATRRAARARCARCRIRWRWRPGRAA